MKLKKIVSLVIILIFILNLCIPSVLADDGIQFIDENLKNLLVKQYDTNQDGEMSVSEMEQIDSLTIDMMSKVTRIDDLKYATNLSNLSVTIEAIEDVTPLKSLTNLKELKLDLVGNILHDGKSNSVDALESVKDLNLDKITISLSLYDGNGEITQEITKIQKDIIAKTENLNCKSINVTGSVELPTRFLPLNEATDISFDELTPFIEAMQNEKSKLYSSNAKVTVYDDGWQVNNEERKVTFTPTKTDGGYPEAYIFVGYKDDNQEINIATKFMYLVLPKQQYDLVQRLQTLIPNTMDLNIKESEYDQAETIVQNKLNEIYTQNNIMEQVKELNMQLTQIAPYGDSRSMFDYASVEIEHNGRYEVKEIKLNYSNTNEYSVEDEKQIKSIQVAPIPYAKMDIEEFKGDKNTMFKKAMKKINEEYRKSINKDNVDINILPNKYGTNAGISIEFQSADFALFKNDVYYETKDLLHTVYCIPVINTKNFKTDNIEQEAAELLKSYYDEKYEGMGEVKNITLTKGATIMYGEYNNKTEGEVANGYTVKFTVDGQYNPNKEDIVILEGIEEPNVSITDNQTNIKVEAESGVVPQDTVLEVDKIESGEDFENIQNVLKDIEKFKAFDITLKSNGEAVQPNGNVTVNIPIPSDYDTSKIKVYRIEDNETKTKLNAKVVNENGTNYAQFETNHFSKYVLAENDAIDVLLGDVNEDGRITAEDAQLVLAYYVGKEKNLTDSQKEAADVTKEGKITAEDASKILQYYVGKIKEF